jgi:hypothetical protein
MQTPLVTTQKVASQLQSSSHRRPGRGRKSACAMDATLILIDSEAARASPRNGEPPIRDCQGRGVQEGPGLQRITSQRNQACADCAYLAAPLNLGSATLN